jgi:hypothetical protein
VIVACVDIGSTFTKAAHVDVATGMLVATAQAATTQDDVVTGVLAATADFPDAEQATPGREAVGVPARRRTVEGDLGVSRSVDALRAAAAAEGLPVPGEDPLPLGEAAATVALRRHLRAEAGYGPGGASARSAGHPDTAAAPADGLLRSGDEVIPFAR